MGAKFNKRAKKEGAIISGGEFFFKARNFFKFFNKTLTAHGAFFLKKSNPDNILAYTQKRVGKFVTFIQEVGLIKET